ncbi:hypothetical protein TorRG33x02_010290 [Trema orientale]|uniref:Retroviral polymerase SH3-like domain-containing protein n=1 Tax=Trema orientale TaxID=63057 RepID=A0A2P5FYV0_TREOI|nr:hypothetical protein TorRG33x02_010290 [Trema orientale]
MLLKLPYIINQLPTIVFYFDSPFQVLYKCSLDYSLFATYLGCLCFPYTRPYYHYKIQFRYIKCIFLGYITFYKGYMCLDYISSRMYVTRHIIFCEQNFSLSSLITSSPLPTLSSSPSLTRAIIPSLPPSVPISISSTISEPHIIIDTSTTSMESGNSSILMQVLAVNTHPMIT